MTKDFNNQSLAKFLIISISLSLIGINATYAQTTSNPLQVIANVLPADFSPDLLGKIEASRDISSSEISIVPHYTVISNLTGSDYPLIIKKLSTDKRIEINLLAYRNIDLEQYNAIDFIVENTATHKIKVTAGISQQGQSNVAIEGLFRLPAQSGPRHILLSFDPSTGFNCMAQTGVARCPAGINQIQAIFQRKLKDIDLSQVNAFKFVIDNLSANEEFRIHAIKPVRITYAAADMTDYTDEFGQYAWFDFPNKLRSSWYLPNQDGLTEPKTLQLLSERFTKYGGDRLAGGYKNGDYFSVQKISGKWWLVDPQGSLFYAKGVHKVDYDADKSFVVNRSAMFKRFPGNVGMLNDANGYEQPCLAVNDQATEEFCGGRTFNFYLSNLIRKYQKTDEPTDMTNIVNRWGINTLNRMRQWGFNAHGSSRGIAQTGQLAYVNDMSFNTRGLTDYSFIPGTQMPDLFDPKALIAIRNYTKVFFFAKVPNTTLPIARDPYAIGTWSDNALEWGHADSEDPLDYYYLIVTTLKQDGNVYTKTAFINKLKEKYSNNFSSIKAVWGNALANVNSWNQMISDPIVLSSSISGAVRNDLSILLSLYAQQYFRNISTAIKAEDPNHLYLGARFGGFNLMPKEVIDQCAVYCDVMTVNYLSEDFDENQWAYLISLDKPIIISGFQFGSNSQGGVWGGAVTVSTEEERIDVYKEFMKKVISQNKIVGTFYNSYLDHPASGTQTLDNYHAGMVTIVDRPYISFVETVKTMNDQLYDGRDAKQMPPTIPGADGYLGDVSGNGIISILDASLISSFKQGLINLTPAQRDRGDVNRDNLVDAHDAKLVAKHSVGLSQLHLPGNSGLACEAPSQGFLLQHMSKEIDERIAQVTGSIDNAKRLWTLRGDASGGWQRNSNAWTNKGEVPLDLTGVAAWNETIHTYEKDEPLYHYRKAGVLITPKFLIFAKHHSPMRGKKIVFIDKNNNPVVRTIVKWEYIRNDAGGETDIAIGLLDQDVPNTITHYPLFNLEHAQKYLVDDRFFPILLFDQEGKALIDDMSTQSFRLNSADMSHGRSNDVNRQKYYEQLTGGDSGNPAFAIVNGVPVLLFAHFSNAHGPSLAYYRSKIQGAIDVWSPGYAIKDVDLSCFHPAVDGTE